MGVKGSWVRLPCSYLPGGHGTATPGRRGSCVGGGGVASGSAVRLQPSGTTPVQEAVRRLPSRTGRHRGPAGDWDHRPFLSGDGIPPHGIFGSPSLGHSDFRQVGSAAVLRCVQEAILGERGGDLSRVTERLAGPRSTSGSSSTPLVSQPTPLALVTSSGSGSLGPQARQLRAFVRRAFSSGAAVPARMRRSITHQILSDVMAELAPQLRRLDHPADLGRLLDPVRASVAALRTDFLVTAGQTPPTRVVSPGLKAHLLATPDLTCCGWRWQACPGAQPELETAPRATSECRMCMRQYLS